MGSYHAEGIPPRYRSGGRVGPAKVRLDAAGCERAFEEFDDHPTQVVCVESVRMDGRDARLHLVRTRLRVGDRERLVVIGVRAIDGHWRVVQI